MAHAAGRRRIDEELAAELKSRMPLLSEDEAAHRFEHALEVQLPFLQVLAPGFRFVPITVGTSNFEALSALGVVIGNALAQAAGAGSGDCFQRHEPLRERQRHPREGPSRHRSDARARPARPLRRGARGRHQHVRLRSCGRHADGGRKLGATQAELIRYATSGDVSGERDMVVGYAGIAVW